MKAEEEEEGLHTNSDGKTVTENLTICSLSVVSRMPDDVS